MDIVQHQKNIRRLQFLKALCRVVTLEQFSEYVSAERCRRLRAYKEENEKMYSLIKENYEELTHIYQKGTDCRTGYHINHIKSEGAMFWEIRHLDSQVALYLKQCNDKKLELARENQAKSNIHIDKNKINWITK